MKIYKTFLVITLLLLCKTAICQEMLTPLRYNPLLSKRGNHSQITTRSGADSAISLPFVDDFSYSQKYPSQSLYPSSKYWIDSNVYINNSYGVNPPTIGVATFDGLDKYGQPYSHYIFNEGWADSLTSRPINLGANSPADSIYLSFFYQPQGNGDAPLGPDSLVLEFKDDSGKWNEIWSIGGDTALKPFKQVLILVTDNKYFDSSFQFKFKNWATLSGNNNNWNLDYVKMAAHRNVGDKVLLDAAFQYNSQSILKNYTQMPWVQFDNYQSTELRSSYSFTIRNNYSVTNNINYIDSLINLANNSFIPLSQSSSSINIDSESSVTEAFPTFNIPKNIGFVNSLGDSVAEISVRTNIAALVNDGYQSNDTIYHDQFFDNYFAYDDGTAETAYSLLGNGSSPEMAVQFHLNQADTLRAIQVFFPYANAVENTTTLLPQVWTNLSAQQPFYQDTPYLRKIVFVDSLNGFTTYVLRHPQLMSSGTFYVGFEQVGLDTMYVGFDVNDNDSTKLYYNVGNGFTQTQFHGIVMIRPVFGRSIGFSSGIAPSPIVNSGSLIVYPDPVKDVLRIKVQNSNVTNASLTIENILGQAVINTTMQKSLSGDLGVIDVSNLPAGMYFVHVTDKMNNKTLSAKFIKSN